MLKPMSENQYITHTIKQIQNDIMQSFKDKYIKHFQEMRNTNPIPKWTEYMKTDNCKKQLKKLFKANSHYVMLTSKDVKLNPDFIEEYNNYVRMERKRLETINQKAELEKKKEEAIEFLNKNFLKGEGATKFLEKIKSSVYSGYSKFLQNGVVQFYSNAKYDIYTRYSSVEDICENYDEFVKFCITESDSRTISMWKIAYHYLTNRNYYKNNKQIFQKFKLVSLLWEFLAPHQDEIVNYIKETYPLDDAINIMNTENEHYKGTLNRFVDYNKKKSIVKDGILQRIPDNYIDLFPLARKIHRKFTLHIGGTNSGKTYSAMQALREHDNGVYLGPLRLLAYEQYDKLNTDGYPCTLKTGEEIKEIPNAKYQASTIEMLDLSKKYDMIVIDEAQLISDKYRGGAWTNAILGGLSECIHVCAAPEAEKVLVKIITSCGDEYEIIRHERNTPLLIEENGFTFKKKDIQKGDALIVFSKKSVHSVSSDLKELGIKSSIIYGALPYDVRQNEAKKFADGITDVVVTTDAIGLGMNLPIKRVVFLETKKYDGEQIRNLMPQEIKQIAGRAGRYGIFDEGYVNTYENMSLIREGIEKTIEPIGEVYLRFPESLIGIDGSLSFILEQWEKMSTQEGFKKADVSHEKNLCKIAETYTDDKSLIYDFITIPFEDENSELLNLWSELLYHKIRNEHCSLHAVCKTDEEDITRMNLQELEFLYKIYDLMFYYNEKFEDSLESIYVMESKELISNTIMKLLDKQKIPKRKCKRCGRKLPWSFKYNVCEFCHNSYYDYMY